jgi:hypothetical protein
MLDITITSEHTGHWTKMLRSLALFSGPEASVHTQSLADFITTGYYGGSGLALVIVILLILLLLRKL